jgi:hypothetical protein
MCDERALKKDMQEVIDDPDMYAILLGDQSEFVTKNDRTRFSGSSTKADLLDELDTMLNAQLRHQTKMFRPLAETGRTLGAHMGNHEYEVIRHNSFDVHGQFCENLGIKNLGYSSLIRVELYKKGHKRGSLVFYSHHGHGGNGRYTGASINRMEQCISEWDFDVCFMGHNHKNHSSRKPRLGITTKGAAKFTSKDIVLIRAGGYRKGYQEGKTIPDYVEKTGYAPLNVGGSPILEVGIEGVNHDISMTVIE